MRLAICVAAGGVVTHVLWLLKQVLIESDKNPFSGLGKGGILGFIRLGEDKEVEPKPRRPNRPPPEVSSVRNLKLERVDER